MERLTPTERLRSAKEKLLDYLMERFVTINFSIAAIDTPRDERVLDNESE